MLSGSGKTNARRSSRCMPDEPTRTFILLSQTMNADDWNTRYDRGLIADWSPYGYAHARTLGCPLVFSRTGKDSALVRLVDGAARLLFGFKIVHAIRNWRAC